MISIENPFRLQLPDQVRTQPKRLNPDETLKNILSTLKTPNPHSLFNFKTNILNKKPEYIELEGDLTNFKNVYDWHFMFLSSGKNCPDLKIFIGKLILYNFFTNLT